MKRIKLIVALVILVFYYFMNVNCFESKYIQEDLIKVDIEQKNIKFRKNEDKYVILRLNNNSDTAIIIPEWLKQGLPYYKSTEVDVEIQRKDENSNKFVKLEHIDVDYSILTFERKSVKIAAHKSYKYNIEIDMLYNLNVVGKYRLIAIVRLPGHEKVKTNWIEFEVIE
jgi:hypothetical protein